MIRLSALFFILIPSQALSETWARIDYLPEEEWQDPVSGEFFMGDSFTLAMTSLEGDGPAVTLSLSCNTEEPFWNATMSIEGAGVENLPVEARIGSLGFEGDIINVEFETGAHSFSEEWNWFHVSEKVISGQRRDFQPSGLSLEDLTGNPEIQVRTMERTFRFEMFPIRGYLRGFERQCGELVP